jgi:hypothetical protein
LPKKDCPFVARIRNAGAMIVEKTSMHECGMGRQDTLTFLQTGSFDSQNLMFLSLNINYNSTFSSSRTTRL